MTIRPVTELKGKYQGYDIHVVAAGPSAGLIDPAYFNNKLAIGVNEVYRRFPNLDYLVRKEAIYADEAFASGSPLIMSEHSCGMLRFPKNRVNGDHYIFTHRDNLLDKIDLDVIGTDRIVVSWSTITSGMHLAAYMGAANIILVGHDCGRLDGKRNMDGYREPPAQQGEQGYLNWLTKIEPQTIAVRKRLMEVYGCRIYSLNPFVNFGLEGHRYER